MKVALLASPPRVDRAHLARVLDAREWWHPDAAPREPLRDMQRGFRLRRACGRLAALLGVLALVAIWWIGLAAVVWWIVSRVVA